MDYSPYSTDLVPNNFFLFSDTKDKIRGIRFNTSDEVIQEFEK